MDSDLRIEPLSLEHADALYRFEADNRDFFAAHVADRGDAYFLHFTEILDELIAETEAGRSLFFVILDADDELVGRVNVTDLDRPQDTELGFRVAEHAQGRGVASTGVRLALECASGRGVRVVHARASTRNVGSQRVLERSGFERVGPAPTPAGSSDDFIGFRRHIAAPGGACSAMDPRKRLPPDEQVG